MCLNLNLTGGFHVQTFRIAVAIVRYYFYSVTGAVASLLNLTSNGSDAINKVAIAHICVWCFGQIKKACL